MDSRSLLSSTHKQLESVSTSIHFQPIISLRRQPASASFQRDMLARSEILALHHSIASARWRKNRRGTDPALHRRSTEQDRSEAVRLAITGVAHAVEAE
jgi:hypothetical protein